MFWWKRDVEKRLNFLTENLESLTQAVIVLRMEVETLLKNKPFDVKTIQKEFKRARNG